MSDTDVQDTIEYPQIIAFPDRGHSAIAWIDYFDETTYGADKLFFKKRCKTIQEVVDAMKVTAAQDHIKATSNTNTVNGIQMGNFPIASINRYNVPDKKFLTFPDALDPYPYKAKYAMRMLLRIKFYNDFGYMEIGIPWKSLYNEDGTINTKYPTGKDGEDDIDATYNINGYSVLNCTWISKRDAEFLLKNLKNISSAETLLANGAFDPGNSDVQFTNEGMTTEISRTVKNVTTGNDDIVAFNAGPKTLEDIQYSLGTDNLTALGDNGDANSQADGTTEDTPVVYTTSSTSPTVGEPDDIVIFSGNDRLYGDDEAKYQKTES